MPAERKLNHFAVLVGAVAHLTLDGGIGDNAAGQFVDLWQFRRDWWENGRTFDTAASLVVDVDWLVPLPLLLGELVADLRRVDAGATFLAKVTGPLRAGHIACRAHQGGCRVSVRIDDFLAGD